MNLAFDKTNGEQKKVETMPEKKAPLTADIAIQTIGVSGWLSEVQNVVERLAENENSQSKIDAIMRENQKTMDELLAKLATVKEEHLYLKEQMKEKEEEYLTLKIQLRMKLKNQDLFDHQSPYSIRPEDLARVINLRDKSSEQTPQISSVEPSKKN